MTNLKQTNACPVCGEQTKEDETLIFCDNCGFNIPKKEEDNVKKPKPGNEPTST